jgi:hypothetical protein
MSDPDPALAIACREAARISAAAPQTMVYVMRMPRGNYVALCTDNPHLSAGRPVKRFVRGVENDCRRTIRYHSNAGAVR